MQDIYETVTQKIVAQIEAGIMPWARPWNAKSAAASFAMPVNASTGRTYSGVNVLLLWDATHEKGYERNSWLTFKQALDMGGNVRKGEKGAQIVFADRFTPKKEKERAAQDGDEAKSVYFLKAFTVFNVEQCENLPETAYGLPAKHDDSLIDGNVKALIKNSLIDFRIGGDKAFYVPHFDYVQVPRPEAFYEPINWHRTALHELGHATGHASRLNRDQTGGFGSKAYAFEELVAEITAAFTCARLGIAPTVRHADYVGSWLQVLKNDTKAIFRAASAAAKAADMLMGFAPAQVTGSAPERVPAPALPDTMQAAAQLSLF
ncbi:ArdC family protein [Asticcacaulis taihuensis]|uniref:ArdC family protein n=1 Tax=Asticcacaulis taihuensis TaxID=260084 RepID=UPI0026E9F953|nr:zincin-like metallopeptidase domain-containing protein [Asticcacaulis taihuensis]